MTQPVSNQGETSKMKRLLTGATEDAVTSRLPRANRPDTPRTSAPGPARSASPSRGAESKTTRLQLLPAFWTFASVFSLIVNIVLIAILLVVLQMFGVIGAATNDQVSGLLGGLYINFVKMDAATIRTVIPVRKEIPVNFVLNVSGPTDVTLRENVTIDGALVTVNTGGLNINNARANIVLPAGTVLPIFIQSLDVPVNEQVLAELDVEVNIPLNQTELHEPFVGLQNVIKPLYCLVEPFAMINNVRICP
jgi:hypothetical protein